MDDGRAPSGQALVASDEAHAGLHPTGFDPSRGLHILQHSLGVDRFGRGRQYRNHFVTGEGSLDYPDCQALVAAGLMRRQKGSPLTGGYDAFFVTDEGRRYVSEHSPCPPKLTRSQARYRRYLAADGSLSFGEWLRRSTHV
jgi:hypothetical protein